MKKNDTSIFMPIAEQEKYRHGWIYRHSPKKAASGTLILKRIKERSSKTGDELTFDIK